MLVTLRFAMPILLLCSLFFSSFAYSASVIRGPYLQMGTDKTMTVRWRTETKIDSVVRYGSSFDNLNQTATVSSTDTEHEVTVTGLSPLTQYYYSVGSSDETVAGGDSSYRFTTSPSADNSTPTRVLLFGDSGTESDDADAVYKAYLNYPGAENTNLWIMLGDNAYNDGTDSNYQNALFKVYPELLRRTPLWSTLGNHDGHSADSNSESGPYYDIFTFPRNAEVGGLASGTEAYYSFDYGNIHFVCLDSYGTDRSAGGAMMSWLENDLSVNNKKWLIAFWHHPAYSKGSHDSDSEDELVEMRQNALPILEKHGVDLVFSGHSHSYERSFLLDSHYGTSGTLNSSHLINKGDGRENGDGVYQKANQAHAGAVYTVAGASGYATGGDLNHPAMFSSLNQVGSVVLDITNDRIDAKYLRSNGSVTDYYSVIKGQNFATSTPTGIVRTPPVDDNADNVMTSKIPVSTNHQRGVLLSSEDTYIARDVPDKNYGSSRAILADGADDSNGELVGLIKWDVRNLPAGTSINNAKIEFEVFDSSSDEYILYKGNVAWNKSNATWNTTSPYSNRGEKIGSFAPLNTGTQTVYLNDAGKSLVQSWINGAANNGIIMMSGGTYDDGVDIHSSVTNTPPKLIINTNGNPSVTTSTAPPQASAPSGTRKAGTVELQAGQNGYNGVQDAFITEGEPDKNYGSNHSILVDGYDDARKELVGLMHWDISSIPSGARITGASLTLHVYDASDEEHALREMKRTWSESNSTWNNVQPRANRGTTLGSFTPSLIGSHKVNFNADGIALIQSWVNGASNTGFTVENSVMYYGSDGVDIRASEYEIKSQRPKLTITYE